MKEYVKSFLKDFEYQEKDANFLYASFCRIVLNEKANTLFNEAIQMYKDNIKCDYGEKPDADVVATTTRDVLNKIVRGRTTFQGAFMAGNLSAKGNFKMLRTFDQVFQFNII